MHLSSSHSGFLLAAASYIGSCHAIASMSRAAGSECCASLSAALSSKVSYPNSTVYDASLSSYWAQQEQLITPSCILSPTAAEEVSVAITMLVASACQFAVRSGGHGSVTGTANIDGGVTIDLRGINSTRLSDDNTLVSLGGGQTLGNVYSLLGQSGLAIAGARDSGIGVGGSTLGGGIGYFGPSQGFACDSVVEYEVVLANGSIVTANENVNGDLWKALKGGGSNFGIVTQYVFRTFSLGEIWAGDAEYYGTAIQDQARAFYSFVSDPNYDAKASILVTYHYTSGSQALIVNEYTYAGPVSNISVFDELIAVPDQLLNNTAMTTLADFSAMSEATSPDGYQEITFSMSFHNSVQMLLETWDIFNISLAAIQDLEGVSWSLTLEPLVSSMSTQTRAKGGDMLGITVPSEGLILVICSATFDLATDYDYMSTATEKLLDKLISAAEDLGVDNRFIDMNHAKAGQNPFAGYGTENWAYLNLTAKKYDPTGVFQTLKPGGFKL